MIRTRTKLVYFDRSIIKKNWKRINESPLKKAGLIVRKIARGSIRRGNLRGLSKDIKQGRGQGGRFMAKAGVNPFERKISERKPGLPGKPPKSWQRGSTPPFKMIFSVPNTFATEVVVGMVGFGGANPIPGLHEHGGTALRRVFVLGQQRRTKKGRFGKRIIKAVKKVVSYPARPFMGPSLDKARSKFPPLWEGSLTRRG